MLCRPNPGQERTSHSAPWRTLKRCVPAHPTHYCDICSETRQRKFYFTFQGIRSQKILDMEGNTIHLYFCGASFPSGNGSGRIVCVSCR